MSKIQKIKTLLLLLANRLRILNLRIGFCSRFELGKFKITVRYLGKKNFFRGITVYLYSKCIANGLDIPNLRIGLYNTFELGIIVNVNYSESPKRKKRTPKGCFGFFSSFILYCSFFFSPQELISSSSCYMNIFVP